MPSIVISYRRSDSRAATYHIAEKLSAHFGDDNIFLDIDKIPYGIDYRDHIKKIITAGDIVLVMIGRDWLNEENRKRLDDPDDPVRTEVQMVWEAHVPLIPVLVDGARMPEAKNLPEPLRKLAFHNAAEVSPGRDFKTHMDRLIRFIDHLVETSPRRRADEGASRPPASESGAVDPVSESTVAPAVKAVEPAPPPATPAHASPASTAPPESAPSPRDRATALTPEPAKPDRSAEFLAFLARSLASNPKPGDDDQDDAARGRYRIAPPDKDSHYGYDAAFDGADDRYRVAPPNDKDDSYYTDAPHKADDRYRAEPPKYDDDSDYAEGGHTPPNGEETSNPGWRHSWIAALGGTVLIGAAAALGYHFFVSEIPTPWTSVLNPTPIKTVQPPATNTVEKIQDRMQPTQVPTELIVAPGGLAPNSAAPQAWPPASAIPAVRPQPVPPANPPSGAPPKPAVVPSVNEPKRVRTVPIRVEPDEGLYSVSLSSQRSESDAQASYRALQAKYPAMLGSREATIRRADLGEKGVFYRVLIVGFATAPDANAFCDSFKAAGGACVVQKN